MFGFKFQIFFLVGKWDFGYKCWWLGFIGFILAKIELGRWHIVKDWSFLGDESPFRALLVKDLGIDEMRRIVFVWKDNSTTYGSHKDTIFHCFGNSALHLGCSEFKREEQWWGRVFQAISWSNIRGDRWGHGIHCFYYSKCNLLNVLYSAMFHIEWQCYLCEDFCNIELCFYCCDNNSWNFVWWNYHFEKKIDMQCQW